MSVITHKLIHSCLKQDIPAANLIRRQMNGSQNFELVRISVGDDSNQTAATIKNYYTETPLINITRTHLSHYKGGSMPLFFN